MHISQLRNVENTYYFHGSKKRGLQHLCVEYSKLQNPFGPAVYLTLDEHVANRYSRGIGAIYRVELSGNYDFTINLDKPVNEQSEEAVRIIQSLISLYRNSVQSLQANAREVIHSEVSAKGSANRFLSYHGIWMIYGELSDMEKTRPMDDGVQYAVLDSSHLDIRGTHSIGDRYA